MPNRIEIGWMAILLLAGCRGEGARAPGGGEPADTVAAADTALPGAEVVPRLCSAAGLELAPQAGLPASVARMRAGIGAAAAECDYARLEALALAGREGFTASFGDGEHPSELWASLEAAGERPMAMLVRTLQLPHARESYDPGDPAVYVWPSAYTADPTPADWRALEELYGAEELADFREEGFIGWRVGIADDGDWLFFVAGD